MTDVADVQVEIKPDKQGAKQVDKDLQKLQEGARSSGRAFSGLAGKIKLIGSALVAAAVYKAIDQWKDFGAAISDLSAITGAAGKDLEYLKQQSLEIGATTTLTAQQAATAFKLIASAKPDLLESGEALARVTKEAVTLAEAAGLDLPTAANALGASLNQFGKGADEASRYINVLAAGSKFGASEINATAEALKEAGTVASSAGLSFEETNAAIQALAGVAIKGGQAGTALRNVIVRLRTQSNDEFNPAIVGLSTALENLGKANLDTAEKAKLFGKLNLASAEALINNAKQVGELTSKLKNTDTAYEQASVKVDNLDGDMKKLGSNMESAGLLIGETFDPALRAVVQSLNFVVNAFKSSVLAVEDFGNAIGAYASAVTLFLSGEIDLAKDVLKQREAESAANEKKLDQIWAIQNAEELAAEKEKKLLENKKLVAAEEKKIAEQRKEEERLAKESAAAKKNTAANEDIIALQEQYTQEYLLLEESLMSQEERLRAAYENRQIIVEDAFQNGLINQQRRYDLLQQLELNHQAAMGDVEAQGILQREAFRKKSAKDKVKSITSELVTLTQGVAQSNKTMFRINKAAAISGAIIDAYSSFNKTMAAYPFPINVGMAAASLAASFAQVQAIKNQQFGGAGGVAPSAAGGGATSSTNIASIGGEPIVSGVQQNRQPTKIVNITLEGRSYSREEVRDLIDSIAAEREDGTEYNVGAA